MSTGKYDAICEAIAVDAGADRVCVWNRVDISRKVSLGVGKMKVVKMLLALYVMSAFAGIAADESVLYTATILPEPLCTLKVPLKLGYQLGIPARDNSAFYAECFSTEALREELARLNESVEIGLLVSSAVNPENGEITVTLNNESQVLKGITLHTGCLLKGRTYIARVNGVHSCGERDVTLLVQPEKGGVDLCRTIARISRWGRESDLEWRFTPQVGGFYNCSFLIEPDSEIKLEGFSLLPEDSVSIWRPESIDVLRSAGAGVFRWPVVSGMDFYNWYDGIGSRSLRIPVQPEKTGLTHHDFGTAEYVDFCRVVGVQPLICVPLYTPGCSDLRIKDLNAATRIAADWVAYCNAGEDHPLAVLRKKNGLGEPLRVMHWEICVPSAGPLLSAEMIASACLQTVNAMKEEDPDILVGVTLQDDSPQTLDVLLNKVGKRMDFVSCNIPGASEKVKNFNQAGGCGIMFAGTTLKVDYGTYASRMLDGMAAGPGNAREYYINWYRSLGLANAAAGRLGAMRDGPVCLPFYAEQVLGLDHGSTRLSTDIGLLSAMIGRFPAVQPLKYEMKLKDPGTAAAPGAMAAKSGIRDTGAPLIYPAWTEGGEVLVVFAYNPDSAVHTVRLDLRKLNKKFAFWIMDQLSADMQAGRKGESVPVSRNQKAGSATDQILECPLGAASFTRILVKE